jgi:hypothetical protein
MEKILRMSVRGWWRLSAGPSGAHIKREYDVSVYRLMERG